MFMATSKKVLILTGSSYGLGEALLNQYLENGYFVFHASRSEVAHESDNQSHTKVDLTKVGQLRAWMKKIANSSITQQCDSITLINNAGRIGEAKAIENGDTEDILSTIQLNLSSVMALCNIFLQTWSDSDKALTILNISSGAANRPIHGWAAYCASKAGLDAFTKTLGLEMQKRREKTKIVSVYPGVVDTPMQEHIRGASNADFPELQMFIDMKEDNILTSPAEAAQKIRILDELMDAESGSIIDIRSI